MIGQYRATGLCVYRMLRLDIMDLSAGVTGVNMADCEALTAGMHLINCVCTLAVHLGGG